MCIYPETLLSGTRFCVLLLHGPEEVKEDSVCVLIPTIRFIIPYNLEVVDVVKCLK